MSDLQVYPVILCGGAGTRLWPVSRQAYPKQFCRLMGGESLFQATARRCSGRSFAGLVVVTGSDFRFIVRDQLAAIGIEAAAIIIEPEPRNTAPAVLAAALWIEREAPGSLMLVAPSDHLIPDPDLFHHTLRAAAPRAEAAGIVTFGITPTRPEIGYGYLELESEADRFGAAAPLPLRGFTEKPGQEAAEEMTSSGRHLWNAGIVLARSDCLISAFSALAPSVVAAVKPAHARAMPDLGFMRLEPASWREVPSISLDHAVLEKSAELWVMPYGGAWSDLGGWEAVWEESPQDGDGVAIAGPVTALGCRNSILRAEEEGMVLLAIGLEDVVAIATADAVLVARRADLPQLRAAVDGLRARRLQQATSFPRDHRPWGDFACLGRGPRFQVKRITVKPGAALSLQSHHHRAEHWIVVQGTARVTIGEDVRIISENQSVYIPLGERHRLENPGRLPMVLIEVQTGAYLEEDDIVRHADVYARA